MPGKRNRGRRNGATTSSSHAPSDSVTTHSEPVPTHAAPVGVSHNQAVAEQSIEDFIGGDDQITSDWQQAGGRRRRRERAPPPAPTATVPQQAPAAAASARPQSTGPVAAPRRARRNRRAAQVTQERRISTPPPPADEWDSSEWMVPDEAADDDGWPSPQDDWGLHHAPEMPDNDWGISYDAGYADFTAPDPWDQAPQYEEFSPHGIWAGSYNPHREEEPYSEPWFAAHAVEVHPAIYNAFTGEWTFPQPSAAESADTSGETRSRRRRYRRRAAARQHQLEMEQQLQQEMEQQLQEQDLNWISPGIHDWQLTSRFDRIHVHTPPPFANEEVRYFVDGWPVVIASGPPSVEEEEEEEEDPAVKEARLKEARDIDHQPDTLAMRYSRACGVCLTQNPRIRVALVECGHMVCAPCSEQLDKVDREVSCPFCRATTGYVRLFETLETEAPGTQPI